MGVTGYIGQPKPLHGTLDGPVVRGYSAYELALQAGYEGTKEEWLESLKVKGDRGYGIKNIKVNDDYTLTIELEDDETSFTTGNMRGPIGEGGLSVSVDRGFTPIVVDENGKTPDTDQVFYYNFSAKKGSEEVEITGLGIPGQGGGGITIKNSPTNAYGNLLFPTSSVADKRMTLTIPANKYPKNDSGFFRARVHIGEVTVDIILPWALIKRGPKGDAYILTAQDKADIYNLLLNDYPAVEEVSF